MTAEEARAKTNIEWKKCPLRHGAIDGICKNCLEDAIATAGAEERERVGKELDDYACHKGITNMRIKRVLRDAAAAVRDDPLGKQHHEEERAKVIALTMRSLREVKP